MEFSWSYSAYSTALQCLRKFQYLYIDKIVPEGPESCDLIFGSAIHSAINAVLTGQNGAAIFEMYWESYKEKDVEYGRYKWADLAQIGAKFVRVFSERHADKYALQFAEKRLYGQHNGIRLEGTPDFYGMYNENLSLRDFKTSSRNYEPAKSDCALQLYLYAYLYKQNFESSRIDTLGYTVFNKSTGTIQQLTWDFDEYQMLTALDHLTSYAKILSPAIGANPPGNFNACLDYNKKCQYFSKCHGEPTGE